MRLSGRAFFKFTFLTRVIEVQLARELLLVVQTNADKRSIGCCRGRGSPKSVADLFEFRRHVAYLLAFHEVFMKILVA